MENNENKNNHPEQPEVNNQTKENTEANKRMAQTGLKGAATAAGAYLGGQVGAQIGSKAADAINNSKIGNAVTDAAAQVGNAANKMSPTGATNQKLTNAAANSGLLDLADKGIDVAAGGTSGGKEIGSNPNATPSQGNQLSNANKPSTPTDNKSPNGQQQDSAHKKTPQQRANKNGGTPDISIQKNPSKDKQSRLASNHSKHADGSNDDTLDSEDKSNPLKKKKSFPDSKKNSDKQETEEEENSKKDAKQFGNIMKMLGTFVTGMFGALGAVGMFIITHIVLISIILIIAAVVILISTIITLLVSFFQYGKEQDGTVCYVTPSCNKVVIKSEEGDKTYSLDEYIAGAIVNYYEHDTYALPGTDVSQKLLQTFSVIIHSDIAAYSDYDIQTETCTVSEESQFTNIYIPTESQNNADDNSSNEEDNNNDDINDNSTDSSDSEQNEENSVEYQKQAYYNQAKIAANTVLNEVVDVYTQRISIFYDGYANILNTSSSINSDYKSIIRDYIKYSPDYEDVISNSVNNLDNSEKSDDNDGEMIGIYPVCDFNKSSTGTGPITYSSEICSTVHVNNGTNAGDYTIDEFIEGVVYNEARAWTDSLDTLKAHAVAARTYLVNRGKVENGTCYMTVGSNTMGFTKSTNAAIHQAVTETSGEYLMVNGQISKKAEWDALCIKNPDTTGSTYTICQNNQQIPKAWFSKVKLFGTISWYNKHSHGRGMSQYGAYYLATVQGKSYKDIINYYYDADVGTVITESKKDYVMPINSFSYINGEITGYCDGSSNVHTGIDFVAIKGTPVYAAHSGIVDDLYDTNYQCGKSCKKGQKEGLGVKIKNSDGTYSLYMHFSARENLVRGQKIEAGQKLGEVGNTGSARGKNGGYHLHYQMQTQNNGTRTILNPRDYLPLDEKGYGVCYKP